MSALNQALLIANVNYHVGHWVAIYAAEDQGFFKEEGLRVTSMSARVFCQDRGSEKASLWQ
jgi:hypothetical protein